MFRSDYVQGIISFDELAKEVANWHAGTCNLSLQEYLGFTDDEYGLFLTGSTLLKRELDNLRGSSFDLKVSVSGSTVYKAVANYLKTNETLQQTIKEKVEAFLESDALESAVKKRLETEFSNWRIKDDLLKVMKKLAEDQIKAYLTEDRLQELVKKVFSNMLVNKVEK